MNSSCWKCAQNPETQKQTPPVVTGQVTTNDLRAQVAEEEGAQQPALSLRIPRVLRDLKQEDGEREGKGRSHTHNYT